MSFKMVGKARKHKKAKNRSTTQENNNNKSMYEYFEQDEQDETLSFRETEAHVPTIRISSDLESSINGVTSPLEGSSNKRHNKRNLQQTKQSQQQPHSQRALPSNRIPRKAKFQELPQVSIPPSRQRRGAQLDESDPLAKALRQSDHSYSAKAQQQRQQEPRVQASSSRRQQREEPPLVKHQRLWDAAEGRRRETHPPEQGQGNHPPPRPLRSKRQSPASSRADRALNAVRDKAQVAKEKAGDFIDMMSQYISPTRGATTTSRDQRKSPSTSTSNQQVVDLLSSDEEPQDDDDDRESPGRKKATAAATAQALYDDDDKDSSEDESGSPQHSQARKQLPIPTFQAEDDDSEVEEVLPPNDKEESAFVSSTIRPPPDYFDETETEDEPSPKRPSRVQGLTRASESMVSPSVAACWGTPREAAATSLDSEDDNGVNICKTLDEIGTEAYNGSAERPREPTKRAGKKRSPPKTPLEESPNDEDNPFDLWNPDPPPHKPQQQQQSQVSFKKVNGSKQSIDVDAAHAQATWYVSTEKKKKKKAKPISRPSQPTTPRNSNYTESAKPRKREKQTVHNKKKSKSMLKAEPLELEDSIDEYSEDDYNTPKNRLSSGINPSRFHNKSGSSGSSAPSDVAVKTRYQPTRSTKKTSNYGGVTADACGSSDSDADYEFDDSARRPAHRGKFSRFFGSTTRTRTSPKGPKALSVLRIAIGKKVFSTKCHVQVDSKGGTLKLSYRKNLKKENSQPIHHLISLRDDSIREMKYFLADEDPPGSKANKVVVIDGEAEDMTFLAMRIQPTDANGLNIYPNAYAPNQIDAPIKQYVAVEFRTDKQFRGLLESLREDQTFAAFLSESSKLSVDVLPKYAAALIKDSDQEKENRFGSPRKSRRSKQQPSNSTRATNETLLVYPFQGDPTELENASNGLMEASLQEPPQANRVILDDDDDSDAMETDAAADGAAAAETDGEAMATETDASMSEAKDPMEVEVDSAEEMDVDTNGTAGDSWNQADSVATKPAAIEPVAARTADASETVTDQENGTDGPLDGASGAQVKKETTSGRAHFITINEDDLERCEPGIYLNDSLIDFWMQWLTRHEDRDKSSMHVFSSHFYTTLSEGNGIEAVTTWTAKKNIDIFTKRFILIPVNKSLHWSLCVVVNPGYIEKAYEDGPEDGPDDDPCPCIFFLDSLKAHSMHKVAKNVRIWLNSEWKRLKKSNRKHPFDGERMEVVAPKIPYQENSWDCGVFVCRYAYALYLLRNKVITYTDHENTFRNVITNSVGFRFGMPDIARLRREIGTLVQNLSRIYLAYKKREREQEEAAAAAARADNGTSSSQDSSKDDPAIAREEEETATAARAGKEATSSQDSSQDYQGFADGEVAI